MSVVPFRKRLSVRLAVGMISVAFILLVFMLFVQGISVYLFDPGRTLIERVTADDPTGEAEQVIEQVQASIRQIVLRTTLISIVVSALLWIYLAIRFARNIAKPIEEVTAASARITAGDLSVRVRVPSEASGETTQLLEHFNVMATSLENYERERTEMIASIAHELRTPLAVMKARLELLEEGLVSLTPQEVGKLSRQVVLLERLVSDLRTLSLFDADRLLLHKEDIDLGSLAEAVVDTFRDRAAAQGVVLEVRLEPLNTHLDPDRIAQVLNNLLDNALKHTPAGGTVTVATERDGDYARLSVFDTGPGFAIALDKLFERFTTSALSEQRGTGLGLAIVRALVVLHGGWVAARNQGGARIDVWLPFEDVEESRA